MDNYKATEFKCVLCCKNFPSMFATEMHAKYCQLEDSQNAWEGFGIHTEIHDEEEGDQDDGDDMSVSREEELNYEDLIRLDENVKHPLDEYSISILISQTETIDNNFNFTEDNKRCLICFDDFNLNHRVIRLPCLHLFHEEEILKWFNGSKSCPICRVDINELIGQ
jgi:hypothetical protein